MIKSFKIALGVTTCLAGIDTVHAKSSTLTEEMNNSSRYHFRKTALSKLSYSKARKLYALESHKKRKQLLALKRVSLRESIRKNQVNRVGLWNIFKGSRARYELKKTIIQRNSVRRIRKLFTQRYPEFVLNRELVLFRIKPTIVQQIVYNKAAPVNPTIRKVLPIVDKKVTNVARPNPIIAKDNTLPFEQVTLKSIAGLTRSVVKPLPVVIPVLNREENILRNFVVSTIEPAEKTMTAAGSLANSDPIQESNLERAFVASTAKPKVKTATAIVRSTPVVIREPLQGATTLLRQESALPFRQNTLKPRVVSLVNLEPAQESNLERAFVANIAEPKVKTATAIVRSTPVVIREPLQGATTLLRQESALPFGQITLKPRVVSFVNLEPAQESNLERAFVANIAEPKVKTATTDVKSAPVVIREPLQGVTTLLSQEIAPVMETITTPEPKPLTSGITTELGSIKTKEEELAVSKIKEETNPMITRMKDFLSSFNPGKSIINVAKEDVIPVKESLWGISCSITGQNPNPRCDFSVVEKCMEEHLENAKLAFNKNDIVLGENHISLVQARKQINTILNKVKFENPIETVRQPVLSSIKGLSEGLNRSNASVVITDEPVIETPTAVVTSMPVVITEPLQGATTLLSQESTPVMETITTPEPVLESIELDVSKIKEETNPMITKMKDFLSSFKPNKSIINVAKEDVVQVKESLWGLTCSITGKEPNPCAEPLVTNYMDDLLEKAQEALNQKDIVLEDNFAALVQAKRQINTILQKVKFENPIETVRQPIHSSIRGLSERFNGSNLNQAASVVITAEPEVKTATTVVTSEPVAIAEPLQGATTLLSQESAPVLETIPTPEPVREPIESNPMIASLKDFLSSFNPGKSIINVAKENVVQVKESLWGITCSITGRNPVHESSSAGCTSAEYSPTKYTSGVIVGKLMDEHLEDAKLALNRQDIDLGENHNSLLQARKQINTILNKVKFENPIESVRQPILYSSNGTIASTQKSVLERATPGLIDLSRLLVHLKEEVYQENKSLIQEINDSLSKIKGLDNNMDTITTPVSLLIGRIANLTTLTDIQSSESGTLILASIKGERLLNAIKLANETGNTVDPTL